MRLFLCRVFLLLAVLDQVACPASPSAADAGPAPATCLGTDAVLQFETDFIDLDVGEVVSTFDGVPPSDDWEFYVAFSADLEPHGFLIHNQKAGVEVAALGAACFLDAAEAGTDGFSEQLLNVAFADLSAVMIKTGDGRTFALGNASDRVSETDFAESFQYREFVLP